MLGLLALLLTAGCDTDIADLANVQATASDTAATLITGLPSQARIERTFVVPEHVPDAIVQEALAIAAQGKCEFRPIKLPAGTAVRIVEEGGVRRLFYRIKHDPDYVSDRAENASVAGDPDKGDGIVNALHGSLRGQSWNAKSEDEEFEGELKCACSREPQNQTTGCTVAYNSRSGHMYCDAYGSCNQCTGTVS